MDPILFKEVASANEMARVTVVTKREIDALFYMGEYDRRKNDRIRTWSKAERIARTFFGSWSI